MEYYESQKIQRLNLRKGGKNISALVNTSTDEMNEIISLLEMDNIQKIMLTQALPTMHFWVGVCEYE